jgi:hypothetical protein
MQYGPCFDIGYRPLGRSAQARDFPIELMLAEQELSARRLPHWCVESSPGVPFVSERGSGKGQQVSETRFIKGVDVMPASGEWSGGLKRS